MSICAGFVKGVTDVGTTDTVDNTHAAYATLVFTSALFINLNAALWTVQTSRYRLNLQVAYISAVAAWTHYEMYIGKDWYVAMPSSTPGRTVRGYK
jgi:hypothetical protein